MPVPRLIPSIVALLALAACDSRHTQGASTQARSAVLLGKQLASIAAQANQAAPANIDPDTRLDGAKAGPGLRLTTSYTLMNAESNGITPASFGTKLVPRVTKASCTNPELRPLLDQGVLVVLEYRGLDGQAIGAVKIDRAACRTSG